MLQGVIYIATGRKYIEEAFKSVASLKAATPSVHVTLFCDEQVRSPYVDDVILIETAKQQDETFSQAVSSSKGMFNKVYYMGKSPYERTLFLDTDTYIVNDISDLFPLLDRFDIAVAHAPHRSPRGAAEQKRFLEVPRSFPVMNSGVILFGRSDRTSAFFSEWLRLCESEYSECNDQASFRNTLYYSEVRIATLTPEYNYRFRKRLCINGVLKILHGRHSNLPVVAKKAEAFIARGIAPPLVASDKSNLLRRFAKARKIFSSSSKAGNGILK